MAERNDIDINKIKGQVDIGIITMREDEFSAVLQRFPRNWATSGGEARYNIAEIPSHAGPLYVAVMRTPEQGHGAAQLAASNFINDLDPSCLVLVGIGGAYPEFEFSLGDVVVATRIHDFSVTAALTGGRTEIAAAGGPMHSLVQKAVANLAADKDLFGDWYSVKRIGVSLPSISIAEDKFFGDEDWQGKVKAAISHRRKNPRQPLVTAAAVASGNMLVKDPEKLESWLEHARDLKAVEMELPGVFIAARSVRGDKPILAIRGISDVVGYKHDSAWTAYACYSAASFAYAFISARQR
ncbi:MAG: hypothetical protein WCF85_16335 [Rhodospirillaceae bacterium]